MHVASLHIAPVSRMLAQDRCLWTSQGRDRALARHKLYLWYLIEHCFLKFTLQ